MKWWAYVKTALRAIGVLSQAAEEVAPAFEKDAKTNADLHKAAVAGKALTEVVDAVDSSLPKDGQN